MEATLNTSTYDAYISSLDISQRGSFSQNVRRLQQLSTDAEVMADFLLEFGKTVAELYAATSVAVWFRTPAGTLSAHGSIQRKVSVGWQNLGLDEQCQSAHDKLVDYALSQPRPIAVRPFSAHNRDNTASNPTDSFLLLGPVKYEKQNVAVLEIALGPKPLRRPHQELVSAYLDWLDWLGRLLQAGLERCSSSAPQPFLLALETVQQATLQAQAMQEQIRHGIEASLRSLAGQNFGSLQENQLVAKQVHQLLESKALRVQCPECGMAAILRCQKAGNSKTGAFMYDHYLDTGRTFHGGQTIFPEVTLVAKPARRPQKR